MKVDMKLEGLNGVLETLKSLPPEIVSKRGGPVKAALRKAARVIHKEAQQNLDRVTSNTTDSDEKLSTGLLKKNLIVSRGKPPFDSKGERYLVRVRRKSYPRKGKTTTTLATANLLEYGSSQQQAEPWLRPAFTAKAQQAIATAETELFKQIDKVVKKLANQNKGK
jgi:HK97 gp10 family phage protein